MAQASQNNQVQIEGTVIILLVSKFETGCFQARVSLYRPARCGSYSDLTGEYIWGVGSWGSAAVLENSSIIWELWWRRHLKIGPPSVPTKKVPL